MSKSTSGFVLDLLNSMPSTGAKMACTTVLYRWAGNTVYIPAESRADRRRRAAMNMLANGMPTPDVARAISDRFNVTQRTAYRDVEIARKMSEADDTNSRSNSDTFPTV